MNLFIGYDRKNSEQMQNINSDKNLKIVILYFLIFFLSFIFSFLFILNKIISRNLKKN